MILDYNWIALAPVVWMGEPLIAYQMCDRIQLKKQMMCKWADIYTDCITVQLLNYYFNELFS